MTVEPAVDERVELVAREDTRLVGTLTRPTSSIPVPAALLISGSGPLDRDSNMPGQRLNVANALASALAAQGVASFRYDKRGVGESGGEYVSTGFEQETADAFAALEALRGAPGIDGARLTVVGHSAGATIAIRLACADPGLAGGVLLCASSRAGAEVMRHQSERIAASMRGLSRLLARPFLRLQARDRRRLLASTGEIARIHGHKTPARWFREYMAYDPSPDLRGIRCPLLAITGRSDLQVDPDDVACIGELVAAPFTGHTPEGLTHLLRKHPGPPSLRTYRAQLEDPVDADLLDEVAAWTKGRPEGPPRLAP